MPKVLQINTTLNTVATGRIAEQIAMAAEGDGWDCYIAHGGRYVGKSLFKSIQISSKWDNYIHAFEGEYLGRHGLASCQATKKFVKKIKELNPDIIHLHNIHGYYLNYKILFEYLAFAKIPIVWTLHDCWSFTGHCTHFDNAGCNKWKTGCDHCPLQMAQYKSRIIDRSHKNYLLKKRLYESLENVTIVPVSNWLGELVKDSILGRFPVKVINNGIDLSAFSPRESLIRDRLGIDKNKVFVLAVIGSGLGYEKGRREFVELSKISDYQLVLVGLSERDMKGLPDSIIKLGRTSSQQELAEFYSAADLLINPTYNDTFPTVNLEALACGTPIVTYKSGGSPDTIDDQTGIVVERGDIEGLVNAINYIKSQDKNTYSSACRERAEKLYNKDERFKDYITLYHSILSY